MNWARKYYNDAIRVYPETRLLDLRAVLIDQVTQSGGILPQQFVFLKSVGRALTLVKDQQEGQLKVKNFLPPFVRSHWQLLQIRSTKPFGFHAISNVKLNSVQKT